MLWHSGEPIVSLHDMQDTGLECGVATKRRATDALVVDVRAAQEVVQRRVLRHALAGCLSRGQRDRRIRRHAGGLQPLLLRIDARLHAASTATLM